MFIIFLLFPCFIFASTTNYLILWSVSTSTGGDLGGSLFCNQSQPELPTGFTSIVYTIDWLRRSGQTFQSLVPTPDQTYPLIGGTKSPSPTPSGNVKIVNQYSDLFISQNLLNRFQDAGVDCGLGSWWSGSAYPGNVDTGNNCLSWTTSSPSSNGIYGSCQTILYPTWMGDLSNTLLCPSTLTKLCLSKIQGTGSPTIHPTTPTKSPTKSPTKNPTSPTNNPTLPTHSPTLPTKSPTLNPTKQPTNNPTTPTNSPTTPTRSPTLYPTIHPTNDPTKYPTTSPHLAVPGRIMYMIPKGSSVSIQRTSLPLTNSTTYEILSGASTPINSTFIVPISTIMLPVRWSNVVYRLFNITTFSTDTLMIDNCNPANPSNPPGSVTWDSLDGNGQFTCPSINKCILTSDCTDNLNPTLNVTSGKYYNWPDLRSCICSYDIESRIDVPTVSNTKLNVSISELYASYTNPKQVENIYSQSTAVGIVYCNNFIDRQINCEIQQLIPTYIQQCSSQPIGCFNDTLGYAFGGFWNQNFNFTYNIPREKWTLKHYTGIGSILNNNLYVNAKGDYQDPFTSKIFADYLWINNITSLFPVSTNVDSFTSTYQYDLLQGRFYMAQLTGKPNPPIVYSQNVYTQEEATCVLNAILYGSTNDCSALTWENQTDSKFKYPAFSEYIQVSSSQLISSINITLTKPYTAIQVFNTRGELCGTSISPIVGDILTFICIDLPSAIPENGFIQVRYLGASSIVDIPNISLNVNELYLSPDELSSYINYMQFSPNLSYNLFYLYLYLNIAANGYNTNFPFRYNGINWQEGSLSTYSISYIETTLQNAVHNTWQNIANNILQENQYPFNYALQNQVDRSLTPEAINYTSPKQLDYLYYIWEVWLSPRFCGGDPTQCETFNLGKCIIQPDPLIDQRWLNGDKDADYQVRGQEGGCRCFNDFQNGFYNFQLFCSQCLSGYGPLDLNNWGSNLEYHYKVKPLFNETEFPFNLLLL